MEAQDNPPVLPGRWVVRYMLNTLLCDTRSRGAAMRLLDESPFDNEDEAIAYYRERRAMNKYGAGSNAHVVCYPVYVEAYEATHIPKHYCDNCGEGFDDEAYTEVNGDFCSRTCFRNNFQASDEEDDHYDEEPSYED